MTKIVDWDIFNQSKNIVSLYKADCAFNGGVLAYTMRAQLSNAGSIYIGVHNRGIRLAVGKVKAYNKRTVAHLRI